MRNLLVVWMLFVMLLPAGSVAIADDYKVIPEKKGEVVQRTGNNVTDDYITGCRELQVYKDNTKDTINTAPEVEGKGFVNGAVTGGLLGIIVALIFL